MLPEEAQGLSQAMSLLQSRQPQAAGRLLAELAGRFPQQAEIPHLQAVLALQANDRPTAAGLFARALQLAPEAAHIHNNYANFLQASDPQGAIRHYQKALAAEPRHLEAHVNLAILMAETEPEQARLHLDEALRLQPQHPQALYLLGVLAYRRHDTLTAIPALTRSFQLGFEPFQCAYLLAELAVAEQAYPQALQLIQQAMRQPQPPLAVLQLYGVILFQLGQPDAADEIWSRALADAGPGPARVQLLINRAAVAFARKRYLDSESLLLQALEQTQEPLVKADIYENLANARRSLSDVVRAGEYFDLALALRPRAGLIYRQGLMLPAIYTSRQDIISWRERLQAHLDRWLEQPPELQDPNAEVGETLFLLAYHAYEDRPMLEQLARIYLKACPELAWTAPHCRQPRAAKAKRKIGFVSRFFNQHTVGKLMRGLIAHWPREDFEVVVFHFVPPADPLAEWILQQADQTELLPQSLAAAREALAAAACDVLFYADLGMESLTYFLAFARLAPLQVTSWGHGITSGIPNLDYFFSSWALEGPEPQPYYSEKLLLTEHLFPYYFRPERKPEAAQELQLPTGHLYGCLQTLSKLHPDMDDLFAGVLHQDPQAWILLLGDHNSPAVMALQRRFAQNLGPLAERVLFHPPVSEAAFLELSAACAVHLDPLYFGGGNTSYEALAVGAPVVTLPTDQLKGRISYALYQSMGWFELVAGSQADYLAKALRLGTDPLWREAVSQRILAHCEVLYENPGGVQEMAALLKKVAGF